MAESETLQKIKDMILYAESVCLNQFPREHRYTTAASVRQNMDEVESLCIAAWKRYYKKTTLQDMDISLQQLKNRVERCYML
ncbi:MAG: diversity-generating retroelement protein bAvd family protein, partial [Clostridia bacterium]